MNKGLINSITLFLEEKWCSLKLWRNPITKIEIVIEKKPEDEATSSVVAWNVKFYGEI